MNLENECAVLDALPSSAVQDLIAVLNARKTHRIDRPIITVLDFLAIKLAKELDVPDALAEQLITFGKGAANTPAGEREKEGSSTSIE